jgi:hypothetical protein
MLVLVAVVAVILTIGQVIDPGTAFVGAIVVSLALGVLAAVIGGVGGIKEASPPGLRTFLGIVLWLAAVGVFLWLAAAWSDFGSP